LYISLGIAPATAERLSDNFVSIYFKKCYVSKFAYKVAVRQFDAVCTASPMATAAHHIVVGDDVSGGYFPDAKRHRLTALQQSYGIAPM